jgi:hypothetical protein
MAIQLSYRPISACDVQQSLKEASLFSFFGGQMRSPTGNSILTGAHASFTNDFAAHLSLAISYSLKFFYFMLLGGPIDKLTMQR